MVNDSFGAIEKCDLLLVIVLSIVSGLAKEFIGFHYIYRKKEYQDKLQEVFKHYEEYCESFVICKLLL